MEYHYPFVIQLRKCLGNTPSLAGFFAKNLDVTIETVRSWIVKPLDLDTVLFWKIAWLIRDHGYLCRELAEREHLHDLLLAVTNNTSQLNELLSALNMSEKKLLSIIVKKDKLTKKQWMVVCPFVETVYLHRKHELNAKRIADLLKEASDLAAKLNGSAGPVGEILRENHSAITAPLVAILA